MKMEDLVEGADCKMIWWNPDDGESTLDATLVHKPQGPGDLWGFRAKHNEQEFYLNPYAADFSGIWHLKEDDNA